MAFICDSGSCQFVLVLVPCVAYQLVSLRSCLAFLFVSWLVQVFHATPQVALFTSTVLTNYFLNVFFQGTWISLLSDYSSGWITTVPFFLGLFVFFAGFYINVRSDEIMINLRKEKGEGYHIPEGFLFNKVSNPNYLGEFIEWLGWAIMTFSWAGLVFFLWTVCNLFPRAISNHKWYQAKFEDYPKDRKAVIPNII